ncbi:MAG: carboxylating nicotinate-nucleotide diphosphorylase [Oscillospiraceae bacterium]|nr:carboxylating nicotinate-nucleotide diphosphorylase [Oscillospiraceae bacterium]
MMLPQYLIDEVILRALKEDMHYVDLSSAYLFAPEHESKAYLMAKQAGVMCGGEIFGRVFARLGGVNTFRVKHHDGEQFKPGDVLLELSGPTATLLQGERTALNLLQHMSGIATLTSQFVQAVEGTGAVIADTRKTLPGLRALQKYAVTCGGGRNHRYNLSDAVMLKDNHIDACGSIEKAMQQVRDNAGHMVKIEVETRNLDEVQQAYRAGADVIMLDNMTIEEMRAAVQWLRGQPRQVVVEASGDISLVNAREIAQTGVDVLSVGALTHSVQAANISMKIKQCL